MQRRVCGPEQLTRELAAPEASEVAVARQSAEFEGEARDGGELVFCVGEGAG